MRIYLLFVCPARWFLLGDERSSLHLRSYFGPIQQLQLLQTVKQRRIWCLDHFKVYSCLFWPSQEKDRAGSWGSKPLPGSILRNPRRCCNWFRISWFPYLAHILAWHPKLILSNLLHLLQLKTHPLAPKLYHLGTVSGLRWCYFTSVMSGHGGGHSSLSLTWEQALPLLAASTLPPEHDPHSTAKVLWEGGRTVNCYLNTSILIILSFSWEEQF